ncbi:hypothetical protein AQ1_00426 [alpha proteobacterium Q-1]|nr:hypothetical protein AQ1_00426 [alpha proteobacterium Q-1]
MRKHKLVFSNAPSLGTNCAPDLLQRNKYFEYLIKDVLKSLKRCVVKFTQMRAHRVYNLEKDEAGTRQACPFTEKREEDQ